VHARPARHVRPLVHSQTQFPTAWSWSGSSCLATPYTCTPRQEAGAEHTLTLPTNRAPENRSILHPPLDHLHPLTAGSGARPAAQLRSRPFTFARLPGRPAHHTVRRSLSLSYAMAEASSPSSSLLRVPPQRAVALVAALLVLVLLRAPCGGASRPVREGASNGGAATVARAQDGGHRHRAASTTVGGRAHAPPSGPSWNHN
jgi:hypothetical protein